jgi:IclR family acetate operon transcriptional repressor
MEPLRSDITFAGVGLIRILRTRSSAEQKRQFSRCVGRGSPISTPIINSVLKAFTILRAFEGPDDWLTCRELSKRAGMPEASGYRIVCSLETIGAVIRGPNGRFRPGMLLSDLSQGIRLPDLLRASASNVSREIARRFGVTVQVGVLEGDMVSYVAVKGRAKVPSKVGTQLEAYCTGLGKVLLAGLPTRDFDRFLAEDDFVALTPFTLVDKDVFRAQIAQVRMQGFGIDDREVDMDLRCVAVPIRDRRGEVIAAISGSGRAGELNLARQQELRNVLRHAACEIESRMYPAVCAHG